MHIGTVTRDVRRYNSYYNSQAHLWAWSIAANVYLSNLCKLFSKTGKNIELTGRKTDGKKAIPMY